MRVVLQMFVLALMAVSTALASTVPLITEPHEISDLNERTLPALANDFAAPDLARRTDPKTAKDFPSDNKDLNKLKLAFSNAIELCSYVLMTPLVGIGAKKGPIFTKYFHESDRQKVSDVFNTILGKPKDPKKPDPTGAKDLGKWTVHHNGNIVVCWANTQAYTDNYWTDNPDMWICSKGWAQPGLWNITCQDIGDSLNNKMANLATTVLHEYFHWDKFLSKVAGGNIGDQKNGAGPSGTRNLNKDLAPFNAASYTWYATEVWWTTICSKDYKDPDKTSDADDQKMHHQGEPIPAS